MPDSSRAASETRPPSDADDWVALSSAPLPGPELLTWAVRPGCGATVLFSGTVRDHAEGRPGVSGLEYEAYVEQAEPRLAAIAAEARRRWPGLGRVALLHRTGTLTVGECSVLVALSAPHRHEAFEAAHWAIDELKATVPIWKKERWAGGEDWGTAAQGIRQAKAVDKQGGPVRMITGVVLSNLLYPVVAVAVAVIAALIIVARHRRPKSIEANMRTFHRGLRALAPDDGEDARPSPIRVTVHPRPAAPASSPADNNASSERSGEDDSSVPDPEAETG